jgi:hypothetical protein
LLPQRIRVNVSAGTCGHLISRLQKDHGRDKGEGAEALLAGSGIRTILHPSSTSMPSESGWVNGSDIRVDGGLGAYRGSGLASVRS